LQNKIIYGASLLNEEQAVLDFFSKEENLPLGLSVAEQMDQMRECINTRFWEQLHQKIEVSVKNNQLSWDATVTEDKNSDDNLVGLHCLPLNDQAISLRPMLEQQLTGGDWRIYFGLIWSAEPSLAQLALPEVATLKDSLNELGFKNNNDFLAWQWTQLHPRRKDFLLRFSQQPEQLLADCEALFTVLLVDQQQLINAANIALKETHRSTPISLSQLHKKT
jgi:hypothetical protein